MSERKRIAAVLVRRGRFLTAEPLFEPGERIGVQRADRRLAGRIALVEPGRGRGAARIVRELGSPEVARDVVEALVWERLGRQGFAGKLEQEATDAAAFAASGRRKARRDLVALDTFTVDPATARDFDDAISATREGDSIRLWIHIADVAAHVKPGTDLDREAYRRATSVYVPGAVEPMLPAVLSSDACSLIPATERLALTTEILLGPGAEVRSVEFYRSRIRSDTRLSYEDLDELFAGRSKPPPVIAEPLAIAREVAAALAARRGSGALEVDSREPDFDFDLEGNVAGADSIEQTESHRLIEQLMILGNEQVAKLLERKRVPTLYRVHEPPDPPRIEALFEKLAALGIPTPPLPADLTPSQAGELAAAASRLVAVEAARRGHGREAYTSLVLRSLKRAIYSDRNLGHAGLDSPAYCHFTSPIRRYPDLIAHRALLATIGEGEDPPSAEQTREAGPYCSELEREAAALERDADDVCAAFLLERELFEGGWNRQFEGEVSGLIGAGAFVSFAGELGDAYEGFLPARRLAGEKFWLNDSETALVGTKTGRALRLGDPVTVTVGRVEKPRGRVDLEPVDG